MSQFKVNAVSLNIRNGPSPEAGVVGSLFAGEIIEYLDISEDKKWAKIPRNGFIGWVSQKHLTPYNPDVPTGPIEQIALTAAGSAIANYDWHNRGLAPRGYVPGMALVFARVYQKFLQGNVYALEMAKANTGNSVKDALSHYVNEFHAVGMDNEALDANTLRHLFLLMLGLGMQESSGRWCEGRDKNAHNDDGETAEAGLFQTSWNARKAHPLLPALFNEYKDNGKGFFETFNKGVVSTPDDLENFGEGEGREFQQLSKECPAFAAEFTAIALRNIRTHWGPINARAVQLRPEADRMFLRVQQAVDLLPPNIII